MGDDNFYKALSCAVILSWVKDYNYYVKKKNAILRSRKRKKTKQKLLEPIEWEIGLLEKQLYSMKTYCAIANITPEVIIRTLNE